jgi:catechol 2,3-dioxygenase-like lactoylglutathione lyase family enzyme
MSMKCALPSAVLHGLFHIAIKTSDLESTRAFWRDIIGLREVARPDFGYPGAWLGCPQPGGQAIIHIYAGGPALGASGIAPRGTGAIDHVSLSCSGYRDFVKRFNDAGLSFREFVVPGTTLWQLFVYDPSGVQLELTFEGSVEGDELPDMSPGRAYVAGADFLRCFKLSEAWCRRIQLSPRRRRATKHGAGKKISAFCRGSSAALRVDQIVESEQVRLSLKR